MDRSSGLRKRNYKRKVKIFIFSLLKLSNEYATFDNKKGQNKEGIGLGLNICKKLI